MAIPIPPQPLFVLVRPQMGENIGAAARAMYNFGLGRMAIVEPRDGWPNPRAAALASGAGRVLDSAAIHRTTAEAVAQCAFVFATTARDRDMTNPVFTPEAAMARAASMIAVGQRVAVLFGPERTGLENEDIARANAIVSVPVNPEFPSLNLAQCVLLTAYEWRRQIAPARPETTHWAGQEPATHTEVDALAQHYETRLDDAGFFFPPHKSEPMRQSLRNMWSRLPLTSADVRMLHGVLRQLLRGRQG